MCVGRVGEGNISSETPGAGAPCSVTGGDVVSSHDTTAGAVEVTSSGATYPVAGAVQVTTGAVVPRLLRVLRALLRQRLDRCRDYLFDLSHQAPVCSPTGSPS